MTPTEVGGRDASPRKEGSVYIDYLPLVCAEYSSLRAEIVSLTTIQTQTVLLPLGVAGALIPVAFQYKGAIATLLLVPVLTYAMSDSWFWNNMRMTQLASCVREIERAYPVIRWGHFLEATDTIASHGERSRLERFLARHKTLDRLRRRAFPSLVIVGSAVACVLAALTNSGALGGGILEWAFLALGGGFLILTVANMGRPSRFLDVSPRNVYMPPPELDETRRDANALLGSAIQEAIERNARRASHDTPPRWSLWKRPLDPEQRRRLKVLRARHDLTQDALGAQIGVVGSAVGNWETGRVMPDEVAAKLHNLYPEDWPADSSDLGRPE